MKLRLVIFIIICLSAIIAGQFLVTPSQALKAREIIRYNSDTPITTSINRTDVLIKIPSWLN